MAEFALNLKDGRSININPAWAFDSDDTYAVICYHGPTQQPFFIVAGFATEAAAIPLKTNLDALGFRCVVVNYVDIPDIGTLSVDIISEQVDTRAAGTVTPVGIAPFTYLWEIEPSDQGVVITGATTNSCVFAFGAADADTYTASITVTDALGQVASFDEFDPLIWDGETLTI